MIRVILVEDHPIIREGYRLLLDLQPEILLVGQAEGMIDTLQLVKDSNPDVIVIDLQVAGQNGLKILAAIKALDPNARCLILSDHQEKEYRLHCMNAGANGYMLKITSGAELASAIHTIHMGGSAFSQEGS